MANESPVRRIGWTGPAWLAVFCAIGLYYLAFNLTAPVQRDGAHFIFMANNMAHGQPPYWGSWETKNPLVELYWVPFLKVLGADLGLAGAARVAETIWLTVTAMALFRLMVLCAGADAPRSNSSPAQTLMPAGLSALYLVLVMDVRTTDDGLNLSLYQALPELAALALAIGSRGRHQFREGVVFGLIAFVAWFVKQTSLMPVAGIIAVFVLLRKPRPTMHWWTGLILGAAVPVAAFATHLALTDTWQRYALATKWRGDIVRLAGPEFLTHFVRAYTPPGIFGSLHAFLIAHRVWSGVATAVLAVASTIALLATARSGWNTVRFALAAATIWMVAAWAQAAASLVFFSHYFLASIAPVLLVLGLLLGYTHLRIRAAIGLLAMAAATALMLNYRSVGSANELRRSDTPLMKSTLEILPFIKPGDRLFNWNGLPYVFLFTGKPSSYPGNMIWPYAMTSLPEAEREAMLRQVLREPPDVVVAIIEPVPAYLALKMQPMSVARLRALTGHEYALVHQTAGRPGRYGEPVQVYRRK